MNEPFDKNKAKENLKKQAKREEQSNEELRQRLLEKVIRRLKEHFPNAEFEIYLVGSITMPYKFNRNSDVDIVVKGYNGDRFELWGEIEGLINRNVEIINYENCSFREEVDAQGLKVI